MKEAACKNAALLKENESLRSTIFKLKKEVTIDTVYSVFICIGKFFIFEAFNKLLFFCVHVYGTGQSIFCYEHKKLNLNVTQYDVDLLFIRMSY